MEYWAEVTHFSLFCLFPVDKRSHLFLNCAHSSVTSAELQTGFHFSVRVGKGIKSVLLRDQPIPWPFGG